jgi:hypothetical protein
MKTITDHIRKFIDDDNTLAGPGGKFTGKDYIAIESILSGKADNFIVFNNGGGKMFEVWVFDTMKERNAKSTLKGFIEFAKSQRGYIYMQKIKGKEEIFKNLPSAKSRDIYEEFIDIMSEK